MFKKSKTLSYMATLAVVMVGGLAINSSCVAGWPQPSPRKPIPACVCGNEFTSKICIPDDINESARDEFCKEEGRKRNNNENSCPYRSDAEGCGTRSQQRL